MFWYEYSRVSLLKVVIIAEGGDQIPPLPNADLYMVQPNWSTGGLIARWVSIYNLPSLLTWNNRFVLILRVSAPYHNTCRALDSLQSERGGYRAGLGGTYNGRKSTVMIVWYSWNLVRQLLPEHCDFFIREICSRQFQCDFFHFCLRIPIGRCFIGTSLSYITAIHHMYEFRQTQHHIAASYE